MENTVENIKRRLVGRYVAARLVLDVIHRVSDLTLIGDDGGELVVQNQMVDLDENTESGELQLDPKELNQGITLTVHFEFAKRGVTLAHLWVIETEEIGQIVSGIVLRDDSGSSVEIFAAAEACCLYVQMPGLRSSSEPEYETMEYVKA